MAFKAFKRGMFSVHVDNYFEQPEQSKQSEQPERSSNYHQYISLESNNTPSNNSLSNLDGSLLQKQTPLHN